MALCKLRTALKNRIHSTLAKYALVTSEHSDLFVGKGKTWLLKTLTQLPPETSRCLYQELQALDAIQEQIAALEGRIKERIQLSPNMQLLKSLPGVGNILAIVIDREIGSIDRFPTAPNLASYSGVVPRVHASGGKSRYGRMRKQSNQYLKWAFIEAANVIVRHRHHPKWQQKHVSLLYERICNRKGHAIAVGAVARHLAEAAFWMLKKKEDYRDPAFPKQVSPRQAKARA
jgi:transposase